MQELVSIIVLTYKKFDKLERCLKSILSQKYSNIELIISDDGSENFEYEKVEKILNEKNENIIRVEIIHHSKNLGIVKNYNNAIKISKGTYILPLASDDEYYDENTINRIVENFGDSLIATGIREIYAENGKCIGEKPEIYEREKIIKNNFYRFNIYNGNIVSGSSTYYKRKIFEKYGYFDEKYILLEDFPFYCKILRAGETIKFLDFKVIKYNVGGVSTKKEVNYKLNQDVIRTYEEEIENNKGYDKRYLKFLLKMKKIFPSKILKIKVYLLYFDIFIIRLLSKILKKNLYLKIFRL